MDLDRTVRKELATPAVVHFVVQYGLRHYASNSRATNDAVCAVLTRLVAPQVSRTHAARRTAGDYCRTVELRFSTSGERIPSMVMFRRPLS